MIEESSIRHVLLAALTAAGCDIVVTRYDDPHMSLVATDGDGNMFDISIEQRAGKPQPIGASVRFVCEGMVS